MSKDAVESGVIFERLSAELATCEAAGRRIETIIADLVEGGGAGGTPPSSLQELDLLVQRLGDLTTFTGSLAGRSSPDEQALQTALAALKLDRVRSTLSGLSADPADAEQDILF